MSLPDFFAGRTGRTILALARAVFWSASALVLVALCRRGLTLGDEGYLLSQASDILAGKVPYRDLDLFVTPGVWYLIAGLFSFTGPSVIATRIAVVGCLLGTMVVTRRIVKASGGPLWGDFAAGLVPVFAVWAWPAWSFSFYSPWAALAAMAALASTLEWMHSRRSSWLVAGGVSIGLSIAFKQNYGVLAAAGCAAAMLLDEIAVAPSLAAGRRNIARGFARSAVFTALGASLVLVPLLAWLAHQGALVAAFDSLVLRPFRGFADAHSIRFLEFGDLWRRSQVWTIGGLIYMAVPVTSTELRFAWDPRSVHLVEILHVALYWSPVFAFAGLGLQGMRRLRRNPSAAERSLLATTVFAAAFFLGVFPRADFNHLINVYPPVLAMLAAAAAVHFGQGRWRSGVLRRLAAVLAACSFLCFAGLAAIWMNDLRKIYWIPLDAPRAGVLVEPLTAEQLNHEIALLRSMTAEGEPVFALPGLSMLPFLAERPMPTRYYNYYSVHIGHDQGLEAAREIERSGARVILADYRNFFSDPVGLLSYGSELASHLKRNFRPEYALSMQTRMLLVRRDEPLAEMPARELWGSCEFPQGDNPPAFVHEYLLFHSIYHSYRRAPGTRNERATVCRLQVPAGGARLRFALETRQPALAEVPATVTAQAWVVSGEGEPQLAFEQSWPMSEENSWIRKTGEEFQVDLSPWAGKEVTLRLRTKVDGVVPPLRRADLFGFSVMWNDARLESPDYARPAGIPAE